MGVSWGIRKMKKGENRMRIGTIFSGIGAQKQAIENRRDITKMIDIKKIGGVK